MYERMSARYMYVLDNGHPKQKVLPSLKTELNTMFKAYKAQEIKRMIIDICDYTLENTEYKTRAPHLILPEIDIKEYSNMAQELLEVIKRHRNLYEEAKNATSK